MRLLLFVVLLSSAVYAQAMRPAPSPGPLVVQQPPSYPGIANTPAGAGASHGGLAKPEKVFPRSPNKRLLPPTNEAGLWAADGAPMGIGGPRLFSVEIPHMRNEHGVIVPGDTAWCAKTITEAADGLGVRAQVEGLSAAKRACVAAETYAGCAAGLFKWTVAGLSVDQRGGSVAYHDAKATLDHARALRTLLCQQSPLSDEQAAMVKAILEHWRATTEMFR